MAVATAPHFATNGGLNGTTKAYATRYTPHRVADDDDSISTEQFPEFDPSHDGSEDEINGGGNYIHSAAEDERNYMRPNADGCGHDAQPHDEERADEAQRENDGSAHRAEEDEEPRRLSPIEPLAEPESDHRDELAPAQQGTESTRRTSPVTSPPYWRHSYAMDDRATSLSGATHGNLNNFSTESLVPGGITLQDNEADSDTETALTSPGGHSSRSEHQQSVQQQETRTSYGRDRNKACWARSVEVTDHVIVNGSATNIGAFVVWNIRVQTLSGPYMNIRKRYSEFDDFRRALIETFPAFEAAVPVLPPKSVISRFRPRFLEKRRAGLQYFLK